MSLSHPIGDMVTRIRNGQNAGKETVVVPNSKLRQAVLSVLKDEGFITDFRIDQIDEHRSNLVVELKYVGGNGAIQEISVVSKPGRRVYSSADDIPTIKSGRGMVIVSTSKGLMTGREAKKNRLGGEILVKVW